MNSAIPTAADFYRVLPELLWCGFGLLAMFLQPFVRNRHFFTALAFIGALAGTAGSFLSFRNPGAGFYGLIQADAFSFFFHLLVGTVAVLVVLAAGPYLDRERLPVAEFYALLLFATAGMGVLASAQELLTALIGLGFKVAAATFQIWTPDVYEGAPTPVTALFSAGPKAAAFALLLRIFATVPAATHFWFWAFWALAALTMFAGNLGALVQTNVKRLLAYSSIAHAGYILVAFAAVTSM